MLRTISMLLLAALFAPGLDAQITKEDKRKQIEAQIQRMRQKLQQGKLLRSHVRLTVRLKNGNKLKGVVKDGRLIEKVDGLHFVAAEAQMPGAGIRVWYYDDTNSYIFLSFENIAHYKVKERLTTEQLKIIERRIEEEQRKQEALRRLEAQRKQAEEGDGSETGEGKQTPEKGGESEKGEKLSEEDAELKKLLEEFPPTEGWSAARRREIEMRKVTVGAFPDAKSRRFLEVFPDWQRAVDKFGDTKKATPPAPPVPMPAPIRR